MFDAGKVVKVLPLSLDMAGCTHVSRIRRALGLRGDSEVVAWALGIAAGRMPTMTELKARKVTLREAREVPEACRSEEILSGVFSIWGPARRLFWEVRREGQRGEEDDVG